jgi:O-antigen ligase
MLKVSRIDKIIFAGIIALLMFAPLAFGAVHVWAYSLVEVGVFLLLLLWLVDRLIVSNTGSLSWVKIPMNLMLMLLLVFIGLQLLPLPSSVVAWLSPHTHADKQQLFIILTKATEASSDGQSWMNLTHYPHATRVEFLKIGAYCGMFFLVVNALKSKQQIDILILCLIFLGLFEALYAIYQVFTDNPKVWWWESRVGRGRYASGTFIVSNHFAAYMSMMVSLTFGFMIAQKKKSKRLVTGLGGLKSFVQKIVHDFSPESSHAKTIFLFFAGIVMMVSLLMSASRGGIISQGVAVLFMSTLLVFKKSFRKYAIFTIGFCLIAFLYALHLGIEPTLKKFESSEQGLEKRLITTRSMFPMLGDYPITGVGWGNFRYLYPRYVPGEWDGVSTSGYSHNDWVEAGTETGFPGLAIICSAFLIYLYRMTRLWLKRRNLHALGIGAGAMAGLLAISFHSYFDFNMHIPANPLTLAAILGIGYAALHRRGHGASQSFFYKQRAIPLNHWQRFALFALVLLVFNVALYGAGSHFMAEAVCPTEWNSTMNLNWNPKLEDMDRATSFNAGNAQYDYKRALHFMALTAETDEEQDHAYFMARHNLEQALRRNPARGLVWYQLGYVYSQNRYDRLEYLNKWLPLAEECFEEALKCAPMDKYLVFNIAKYWVWRSQLLPKNLMSAPGDSRPETWEEGVVKFQELFHHYLTINPAGWKDAFDSVWGTYPEDQIVFGIVPAENAELQSLIMQELAKQKS